MSNRIQWIQHKGKRILQLDMRALSRDEQLALLSAYSTLVRQEPDLSVLLLVIAGEFEFHPDIVTKAKTHMLEGQPKIVRSALVGVEGILKVAFDGFFAMARLLGMAINPDRGRHFENVNEAKDWLVS